MKNNFAAACVLAVAAVLAGCRSYERADVIDWEKKARAATPRVTLFSPDDAGRLALAGNIDLNAMRLKAAGAASVAKETGWWEDPHLDFDLMRIVDPSHHPFLGGAGFSFTVPLSGKYKAAEKAAEAYHSAQVQKIKAAENDISVRAVKTALAICFNLRKTRTLEEYEKDEGIRRASGGIEKLHAAGECTLVDLNGIKRQAHAREHERMRLKNERNGLENSFRLLAGLHPETVIEIAFSPPEQVGTPLPRPDLLGLSRHPSVKAVLAELERSEAELEKEILKQYPDLRIGPIAGNEEGKDRVGFAAGMTLPLWNRNRKAIAEADSARESKRLEAVDAWKKLALESGAAYAKMAGLLEHPPVPPKETKYVEKLLAAGEISPVEYLSAREEILTQKLEEISWRADVSAAKTEVRRFIPETF